MKNLLRIGTRNSVLALKQASLVAEKLHAQGFATEFVTIKTLADHIQNKALHEIGSTGIFTKALDDALIDKQIDLAVHSLKDMPTELHADLTLAAVLERDNASDVLVYNNPDIERVDSATIATGSLRRRSQ